MIQKIKKHSSMIMVLLVVMLTSFISTTAISFAGPSTDSNGCTTGSISSGIASGANSVGSGGDVACNDGQGPTKGTDSAQQSVQTLASNIINIFSIIIGVVAVIMIMVGGFRYITSGGESNAVGSAKKTIIFAAIGLIIVALAQFIVHVVLHQTAAISS